MSFTSFLYAHFIIANHLLSHYHIGEVGDNIYIKSSTYFPKIWSAYGRKTNSFRFSPSVQYCPPISFGIMEYHYYWYGQLKGEAISEFINGEKEHVMWK